MPNGQPAQLANLKPWKRGNSAPRRSSDVDETLRTARKGAPDAVRYVLEVLRDATESTRWRLKAAEVILGVALPKDPNTLDRLLEEIGGGAAERVFRIEFVDPVEKVPVVIDAEPRETGNGHDPASFAPVFVDPEPEG